MAYERLVITLTLGRMGLAEAIALKRFRQRVASLNPLVGNRSTTFGCCNLAGVQLVGGGLDLLDCGFLGRLFVSGHRFWDWQKDRRKQATWAWI